MFPFALTTDNPDSVLLLDANGQPRLFMPEPFSGSGGIVPISGLAGDVVQLTDATIGAGSPNLSSASANFKPSDVGKTIEVPHADVNHNQLIATIHSRTDAHNVVLSSSATFAVTSGPAFYGTDDGPAAQAFITANVGKVILWPAGNYVIATGINVPDGTELYGYQVTLFCALPNTTAEGQPDSSAFFTTFVEGPNQGIAADTKEGSFSFTTDGTFAKGDVIQLADAGPVSQLFTVQQVAGASPQTVTLSRAILQVYTAATGTAVKLTNSVVNGLILEGFSFVGRATAHVFLTLAMHTRARHLSFDARVYGDGAQTSGPGFYAFADNGCYDARWEVTRITGALTGPETFGTELSTWVGYTFEPIGVDPARSAVLNGIGFGFQENGFSSEIRDYDITAPTTGTGINVASGDNHEIGTGIVNSDAFGIQSISDYLRIKGAKVSGPCSGAHVNLQGEQPVINGLSLTGGAKGGIFLNLGTNGSSVQGVQISPTLVTTGGAATVGINLSGSGVHVLGGISIEQIPGITVSQVNAGTAGRLAAFFMQGLLATPPIVTVNGFDFFAQGQDQTAVQHVGTAGSRLTLRNGRINGASPGGVLGAGFDLLISNSNSVTLLDNVELVAGTGAFGASGDGIFNQFASPTLRYGEAVRFTGTFNAILTLGTAQSSRGTVASAGSGTPIPFTDLQFGERVSYMRNTLGGSGVEPTTAYTPGTGFTPTFVAGDTSTWDYLVGPS